MKRVCTTGLVCGFLILSGCNEGQSADQVAADRSRTDQPERSEAWISGRNDPNTRKSNTNAAGGQLSNDRRRASELKFVGRWASETSQCAAAAWRFSHSAMETPAGSVCKFREVRRVPGGYDIDARCFAEGPETRETLRIRFAESAGGMLFDADSIADAGLVECE